MPSTWIKILSSLPDNPDIDRMVDYLDRHGDDRGSIPICLGFDGAAWMEEREIQKNAVIGALCRVWIWANKYAKPGTEEISSYPDGYHKIDGRLGQLDSVAGIDGFGGAMLDVGWVDHVSDERRNICAIIFKDFDRHNVTECDRNGKSTSAERMRRKRKKDKELGPPYVCNHPGKEEAVPPEASPSPSLVTPCDDDVTQIPSYSYSSSGSSEGGAGGGERKWTHWARFVLEAYPKGKIGPRSSAMQAACRLLEKISLLPDFPGICLSSDHASQSDIDAIVQHAVGLAGRFADAVGDSQYIPHLRTWVDDGWWEMDEEEWTTYGRNPKDLEKQNAQKRASVASSRALEDRAAQRRADDEERQAASEGLERAKAAYRAMTPGERGDAVGRVREQYPMVVIPDPLPDEPTANLARAVARVAAGRSVGEGV